MKSGSSMCLKKGLDNIFTLTAPDGITMNTAWSQQFQSNFNLLFKVLAPLIDIFSGVHDRGAVHGVQRGLQ